MVRFRYRKILVKGCVARALRIPARGERFATYRTPIQDVFASEPGVGSRFRSRLWRNHDTILMEDKMKIR